MDIAWFLSGFYMPGPLKGVLPPVVVPGTDHPFRRLVCFCAASAEEKTNLTNEPALNVGQMAD